MSQKPKRKPALPGAHTVSAGSTPPAATTGTPAAGALAVPADDFEPRADSAAMPFWLFIALIMLAYWGMLHLDQYGGGFNAKVYAPYRSFRQLADLQPKSGPELLAAKGEAFYALLCLQCHQNSGLGSPGQYPPLAGSEWVLGSPARLIRIPLHGLSGPIDVKGQIVVVTLESGTSEIVDAQLAAFKAALVKWPGLEIVRQDEADAGKSPNYGPGVGMSARRFLKLRAKYADANAIISFIGVPDPEDLEGGKKSPGPSLIAISRSHDELAPLFDNGTLTCAIVPRFAFPAPGREKPKAPAEWFESRYQVLAAK